ncbi:MAG: hypothetical protein ACREMH_04280 [Gemmatimonadales bacterium]
MPILAPGKESPLSDASQQLRRQMWLVVAVGILALGLAALGARGFIDPRLGITGGALAAVALAFAVVLGWQVRRQALDDREVAGHRAMIVTMAAMLGQESDATLERIAASKGTHADVARMLLDERRARRQG